MDKPYSMTLQRRSSYYSVSISVKAENVPSDAPTFPGAEELAMLKTDPITMFGIDKDPELPETVVFAQDGIKVTLVRSYYGIFPELCIRFRAEGLPEYGFAYVSVDKINGQEIDLEGKIASLNKIELSAKEPEADIFIKLTDLKELLPDFGGLDSVMVNGFVRLDVRDPNASAYGYGDITVKVEP